MFSLNKSVQLKFLCTFFLLFCSEAKSIMHGCSFYYCVCKFCQTDVNKLHTRTKLILYDESYVFFITRNVCNNLELLIAQYNMGTWEIHFKKKLPLKLYFCTEISRLLQNVMIKMTTHNCCPKCKVSTLA